MFFFFLNIRNIPVGTLNVFVSSADLLNVDTKF